MFCVLLSRFRLIACGSLLIACLGGSAPSCFAQPIFFSVVSTPYDHQMIPVSGVLNSFPRAPASHCSLATINQWMASLRAMPYQYSLLWKTPTQVNFDVAADCKGKAILLYAALRTTGAKRVRFIIGQHQVGDSRTHAWLEWDTTRGTYLLDPTFNNRVERVEEHDPTMYIPHYAYDGSHKYRAIYQRPSSASIVASN
jgi:hypothetical protein